MTKSVTINIFIDAFGWALLQKHDFLNDVLIHKQPLDTVFGYSSTCDPTIISGRMPNEHGHFAFFRYAPESSPFGPERWLGFLPGSLLNRGRVRNAISKLVQARLRYTGYFQLYNVPFEKLPLMDYSEKRDLYQEGGLNYGTDTLFDDLRNSDIPFCLSDWRSSEQNNIDELSHQLDQGDIRFAYAYLASMDADLHRWGPNDSRIKDKIAWYQNQIESLLSIAEMRYDEVTLNIFSDHGMTEIHTARNIIAEIESLPIQYGIDYAAVYDSTMARFWALSEHGETTLRNELPSINDGRLLSDDELALFGCDFKNHEYGDLFFLMDPGVLICPSYMGERPLKGMHGFDPRHPDSIAMFASNVVPESKPKRLDDLRQVITKGIISNN